MLFGHQNDDATQPVQTTSDSQIAGVNPLALDPETGASLPVAPAPSPTSALDQVEEPELSVLNQPTSAEAEPTSPVNLPPPPPLPVSDPVETPSAPPIETPVEAVVEPPVEEVPVAPSAPVAAEAVTPTPGRDDLLGLKQQALAQLEPLVGQLDQTPEERFRTTMMLIQSTDNQTLIKDAYDTAQQITDEKARAQALLDVVNEINYFTQQNPAA